jgi:hypothetical protein
MSTISDTTRSRAMTIHDMVMGMGLPEPDVHATRVGTAVVSSIGDDSIGFIEFDDVAGASYHKDPHVPVIDPMNADEGFRNADIADFDPASFTQDEIRAVFTAADTPAE